MAYLSDSQIPFLYPPALLFQTLWPYSWQEETERVKVYGWGDHAQKARQQDGRQLSHSTTVRKQREDTGDQTAVSFPLFYLVWGPQLLGWGHPLAWLSYSFRQSSSISSHYPTKCLLVQSNWSNQPSHRCFQSLCVSRFAFCVLYLSSFLRL